MKRQSIHQQIDLLLSSLAGQHEQFREGTGTIQQLELDMMLQNTRQLYEAILMLNHTNALSSLDEVKAAVMQRILAEKKMIEKKSAEEPKMVKPVEKENEAVAEKVQPPVQEVIVTRASIELPVEIAPEKSATPKKPAGGMNATLFDGAHTLAEKFEDEETLHEHIASKATGKTVGENLYRKPVRDLKTAIGINEKFLFINQLFDGSLQDYSAAVEKLNAAKDLDSARQFIAAELAGRFNWGNEDHHVKSFVDLVERRFIS